VNASLVTNLTSKTPSPQCSYALAPPSAPAHIWPPTKPCPCTNPTAVHRHHRHVRAWPLNGRGTVPPSAAQRRAETSAHCGALSATLARGSRRSALDGGCDRGMRRCAPTVLCSPSTANAAACLHWLRQRCDASRYARRHARPVTHTSCSTVQVPCKILRVARDSWHATFQRTPVVCLCVRARVRVRLCNAECVRACVCLRTSRRVSMRA
jgi:hypothetical protein